MTFVVAKEGDWYLARAQGLSIFTEATSLDQLKANIKEAVALHLGDGEHKRYGLPSEPTIKVVYEFDEIKISGNLKREWQSQNNIWRRLNSSWLQRNWRYRRTTLIPAPREHTMRCIMLVSRCSYAIVVP